MASKLAERIAMEMYPDSSVARTWACKVVEKHLAPLLPFIGPDGEVRKVLEVAEHQPMCNHDGKTFVTFGLRAGETAVRFATESAALTRRAEGGGGCQ